MEYKGVEYRVLQRVGGAGWKWAVTFQDGSSKTANVLSRAAAQEAAERAIDNKLAWDVSGSKRSTQQDKAKQTREAILQLLKVDQGLSVREIRKTVDAISAETVRNHLDNLCKQGLARRLNGIGGRVYFRGPPDKLSAGD